jgi:FtsH-binding integral membrane protein
MADPVIQNARSTPEGAVFDPDSTSPVDVDALAIEDQQRALLVRVFSLILLGLMTSAAVAYLAWKNADLHQNVLRHEVGFQLMFLFEIAAVAFVSKYVSKFTIAMAWIVFLFYSALNGISFAMFFLWMPPASITFGFFLTALTFGVMALYGRYTKADLGSMKSIGMLVLVGLGLMILINLVLGHDEHFYATSFLGIMFFAGLTASHIRDIRNLDWEFDDDDASNDKAALVGALLIYLDFVNLYMLFMRFIGRTRTRRVKS